MKSKIVPVDADLIRDLRSRGLFSEARELLQSHYKAKKEAKKQAWLEYNRTERQINNHFKKKYGLCQYGTCENDALPNHIYCEFHNNQANGRHNTRKLYKINK